MQAILVPLDGSALAKQVLPYAQALATLLRARVRLLHVVTDLDREGVITCGAVPRPRGGDAPVTYGELAEPAWALLREQAELYLESQAALLRTADLAVDTEVRIGVPRDAILESAARDPDTLIALATHGYGGLRRWALGSVADSVVQATTTPVLIVRSVAHAPSNAPTFQRVLVPLDGSALARRALPLALDLTRGAQAELILLQAVASATQYPGVLITRRNQAAQDLRILAEDLRQEPVTPVVVLGHAAEAIVDEAVRCHIDLIVMATHGYGGLRRWALGSVADKVLHATTTPLLLVRAQLDDG